MVNKVGGRQPGATNKIGRALREAIEEAFDRVGGVQYLVEVAKNDPRTFCGLLGKIIPKDIIQNRVIAELNFQAGAEGV